MSRVFALSAEGEWIFGK